MTDKIRNIPSEDILALLIETKELVKNHLDRFDILIIILRDEKFTITINEEPDLLIDDKVIAILSKQELKFSAKSTLFQLDKDYSPCLIKNEWLDQKSLDLLLLYLPFCFFPLKAFHLKRTISLLHFAQSLDGRIAASNGNSKWIGNHENLVHAHWLRALFDGILIGSNTLKIDKPKLNVRLVKGPNPLKFVIGNDLYEFDSLLENSGEVFFITSQESINHADIENIIIPGEGKYINPITILCELYQRGIQSLFIEGGAFTGSSFITGKAIDFLQIFISPKILGSGISSFSLQEITSISDSIEFSSQSFCSMGNGILFSGIIKY